ncbi:lipid A export ATP-binding/permease MsbA [Klebsiella pneumoniae]|uniref:Lipid A export ATP-binding/permease MsbA n=1 Tax=Klebsiella pneumoniae TaxID=573 RepID=A0A2X3G859_KLEPN|nr:lipid A export ATP-binding/permease MsbA [Klebsiella pneumoniae]
MKSWWLKTGGSWSAERHHDLLEHKGVYAQLHMMQFGE